MNVSFLLEELSAHGVVLLSDGPSLPTPVWPAECPKLLRRSFNRNKRAVASRILTPVFVLLVTQLRNKIGSGTQSPETCEARVLDVCLALIDDQVIVWLPQHEEEDVRDISQRLVHAKSGALGDCVQVIPGHKLPTLLRQAVRAGRGFCSNDSLRTVRNVWQSQKLTSPYRWIDLRSLARSGGWPEDFDTLVWNVINTAPQIQVAHPWPTSSGRENPGLCRAMNVASWVDRIREGIERLLCVADIYDRLRHHDEPDLLEVDQAINARGIGLDVPLARIVLRLARELTQRQFDDISSITCGTMTAANLQDDAYVLSWLECWGQRFPNLHAETIAWSLESVRAAGTEHHPIVEAVLKARLSLARLPIGSLMQALEMVDDAGRVRDHLVYFGTRAGEWASRGIAFDELVSLMPLQLDMSSFADKELNWDALQSMLPADMPADAALASMVSSCFVPAAAHVFAIFKWLGLEESVLAWLSSRSEGLQEAPHTRQKIAQRLQQILSGSRDVDILRCRVSISSHTVSIRLPSGRSINYRQLTAFKDCHPPSVPSWLIPSLPDPTKIRAKLDANIVADDIVRGLCRDVLADSLIRCEDAGRPVVVHGSHFVAMEIPQASADETVATLTPMLSLTPTWAEGMAVQVTGLVSTRLGSPRNSDCAKEK